MDWPTPHVTPETEFFWRCGAGGRLMLQRCDNCQKLRHPPSPVCARCRSTEVGLVEVGGRGHILAFTVNRRSWEPWMTSPFVVAVVGLEEDPTVRLTSNIVNADPDDVRIDQPVRVVFEPRGEYWVPLFEPEPTEGPDAIPAPIVASAETRSFEIVRRDKFEEKVRLTGIGMSQVGRRLERSPSSLTVEACARAVADAGLTWAEIDGLSTYPGPQETGLSEGGIAPIEECLRVRPSWFASGFEVAGQLGAVLSAMLAVSAGLCRHALCYRTVWQAREARLLRDGALSPSPTTPIWGHDWRTPFGANKAISFLAAYANRYLHQYGASRETLGWIALSARRHAMLNPTALYRTELTMDQYLDAPMLSTPFGLNDCDLLCDGAVAIVVSAADTDAARRARSVYVEAVGSAMTERPAWDQGTVSHEPHVFGPSRHLWSRTDLRPGDVDVAQLYDGFTFNTISWLEALGFCDVGEAKYLVDGGHELTIGGRIPLNTNGGQLSAGRLHGFGYLHEAITQLRGEAGDRQVPRAGVAVVASGGLQPGGAMLLRRAS